LSQSILVLDSSPISPSHWPSLNWGSSLTGLLTILPPSLNLVVDLSKFSIQQVLASDPPFPTQISYNHSMIVFFVLWVPFLPNQEPFTFQDANRYLT